MVIQVGWDQNLFDDNQIESRCTRNEMAHYCRLASYFSGRIRGFQLTSLLNSSQLCNFVLYLGVPNGEL